MMKTKPHDPLDTIVEFHTFGTYPGFPSGLQQIAIGIVGKKMSLREAKELFEKPLRERGISGDVTVSDKTISITMPGKEESDRLRDTLHTVHMWNAISFRPKVPELEHPFMKKLRLQAEAFRKSPEGKRIMRAVKRAYKKGDLIGAVAIGLGGKVI